MSIPTAPITIPPITKPMASGAIQFPSTLSAVLVVDSMTDPNGYPPTVLDVDRGFEITGHVDFPGWLSGTGNVSIYADEHGGKYDGKIGTTDFTITASGQENSVKRYNWTVKYPTNLPKGGDPLPDPPQGSQGSQVYNLIAVFMFNGPATDIAGFADMGTYLIN
jgi:hypothetical protein